MRGYFVVLAVVAALVLAFLLLRSDPSAERTALTRDASALEVAAKPGGTLPVTVSTPEIAASVRELATRAPEPEASAVAQVDDRAELFGRVLLAGGAPAIGASVELGTWPPSD